MAKKEPLNYTPKDLNYTPVDLDVDEREIGLPESRNAGALEFAANLLKNRTFTEGVSKGAKKGGASLLRTMLDGIYPTIKGAALAGPMQTHSGVFTPMPEMEDPLKDFKGFLKEIETANEYTGKHYEGESTMSLFRKFAETKNPQDFDRFIDYTVNTVAQNIPQIALSTSAAAAGIPAPLVLSLFGLSGAGQRYTQDQEDAPQLSEKDRISRAFQSGASEVFTEGISYGLAGAATAGKSAIESIPGIKPIMAKAIARGSSGMFAKAIRAMGSTPGRRVVSNAMINALGEGSEEVVSEALQMMSDEHYAVRMYTTQQKLDQMIEAFGIGAIASGVIGGPMIAATELQSRRLESKATGNPTVLPPPEDLFAASHIIKRFKNGVPGSTNPENQIHVVSADVILLETLVDDMIQKQEWSDNQGEGTIELLGGHLMNEVKSRLSNQEGFLRIGLSKYKKDFSDWLQGKFPKGAFFNIGENRVINFLGFGKAPVVVDSSVISKAIEKHKINKESLADLDDKINNPVMVFTSDSRPQDSIVFLLDIRDSLGRPVVASVYLNKRIGKYEVNDITSVHGRAGEESELLSWAGKGNLLYANKEKSQKWLHSTDDIISSSFGQLLADKNIPSEQDLVKFGMKGQEGFARVSSGSQESLPSSKDIAAEKLARGKYLTEEDRMTYPDLAEIESNIQGIKQALTGENSPQQTSQLFKALEGELGKVGGSLADIVKSKPVEQRLPSQLNEKKIVMNEISALRYSLRKQAQAAALASRETTKELQGIKKEIANLIQEKLPVQERGRLTQMLANAKTNKDVAKSALRVDKVAEKYQRKVLVNQIKRNLQKIDASKSIAVEYQKRIRDLVANIETQGHHPETIKNLKKTQAFISEQRSLGKDVSLPQEVLNKVSILGRTPLNQIPVPVLENILNDIETMAELGKTKLRSRQALERARIERDLQDLSVGTEPIEKIEILKPKPGKDLSFKEKFHNYFGGIFNTAKRLDISISPMDVFFDMLDGNAQYQGPNFRIFKKTIDQAYSDFLARNERINTEAWQKANDLRLNNKNYERIGVHAARVQDGGRDKLKNNGLTDQDIDSIKLTDKEYEFYRWMRKELDDLRPEIYEVMRNVYNREMGEVENYFSFMTDWESMSDSEIRDRIGGTVEEFGPRKKNVEMGFTKERKGAGTQKIKLNAMEIFLKHVENASYLIDVGSHSKRLGDLASSEEYREIAGDYGQELVRDWVDLVARKGGKSGDRMLKWLDTLRKNIGAATLGFKLSSAIIQPSTLMDGAALIGHNAFQGAFDVATSKKWREFLRDNFPEVKARGGDDPSFIEFSDNPGLAKAQEAGYWVLKKLDLLSASSIAAGAYRRDLRKKGLKLDLNNPNREAIQEAQLILRRSQSSSFFKDTPPAVSRGALTGSRSLDRALLQFQNFMLNRWSLIRHDMLRAGIMEGRMGPAMNIALFLTLAAAAETTGRIVSRETINALVEGLTGEEPDDRYDDEFGEAFVTNLLQNVPFISQILSVAKYGGIPVPALDIPYKAIKGFVSSVSGKRRSTRTRGKIKFAGSVLRGFGIPGTAAIEELAKKSV